MAERYDAGIVTAYGAAVRGGYTGTYDEFCAQQANYAQTAAAVEQAKTDAQAAAQRAQDVADSIPEDYTELTEEVGDLKDDFHSYHSELGAGYADQIVSGIENEDSVPYNFRAVPYDATLEYVDAIVGGTVCLNQLAPILSSEKWAGNSQFGTCVFDGNKATYTITQKSGSQSVYISNVKGGIPLIKDHKYVVEFDATISQSTSSLSVNVMDTQWVSCPSVQANTKQHCAKVFNSANATGGNAYFGIYPSTGAGIDVGGTFVLENVVVIDLTQTFGTQIADYVYGLETATAGSGVAWLKKNFPKIFDAGYIAYNAGTMVHVSGLSAKKTVGKNQINVNESESGGINASGAEVTDPNNWRGTEYIPVISGMEYVLSSQIDTKRLYFYDESYNFISPRIEGGPPAISATAPVNAKYARWTLYKGSLMTLDDVKNSKTQLEFGSTATTYEPYTMHEYPLDSTIDLHGTLKLDSNNNLYADGDVYKADGTVSRRYGVVDLGTLNWSKYAETTNIPVFYASNDIPGLKPGSGGNAVCDRYVCRAWSSLGSRIDKCVEIHPTIARPYVSDSSYTDADTFKAAMSGVMLVYELATPTTETAEPYTANQICDPYGTEEYVTTGIVPVGHNTKYPDNLRKKLDDLPWNFATLIAPTESTYKATRNYTTGSLFIVNNVLYKATANIANGGTITPNTNCTATTLAEVISALS